MKNDINRIPNPEGAADVSPDSLMKHFRGRRLESIIVFTIVVHVLVLGGGSVPFLWKAVFGPDTAEMDKEERVEKAVREATVYIRKVAEEYDLSPQDISSQFGSGPKSAVTVADAEPGPAEETQNTDEADETADPEEREKSSIEKELEVEEQGPATPTFEDDIF